MNKKNYSNYVNVIYSGLVKREWPEGFILGILSRIGNWAHRHASQKLNPEIGAEFRNRSKDSDKLVIVLVGYKPDLWPMTLERVARFVPKDYDVCLMSSGRRLDALDQMAEQYGWSYLSTLHNEVSCIQNIAIESHPCANYVFKLDEDVFVGKGFFDALLSGHLGVKKTGLHRPGFSAPVINVNGYGYIEFLKELKIEGEYEQIFGELCQAAENVQVHHNGEAALWIWKHSVPFDQVSGRFGAKEFSYSTCPHRFSIGAILFERSLWNSMGGFPVYSKPGVLGYDEEQICKYCMNSSEVIVVIHNVFAGHFGFGPQNKTMSAALDYLKSGLAIRTA
jgi:hypothetical protein